MSEVLIRAVLVIRCVSDELPEDVCEDVERRVVDQWWPEQGSVIRHDVTVVGHDVTVVGRTDAG